ncbi:MAG: leucyl/phenylalanyl-tRNA--protein transferase, partial [Gammaproteobacteria bacterium]
SPQRLLESYRHGIFPWYCDGQPVLWWSPDPRMVLYLDEFRWHRSLVKTVRHHRRSQGAGGWRVTLNRAFEAVMQACAAPRDGEAGTWITGEMSRAYAGLQRLGYAQSVEVWEDESLVGGLYGVSIGRMFFGESMFSWASDASKVALATLVCTLRQHGFRVLDCQQNTRHLASLGAREISRAEFLAEVAELTQRQGPDWRAMAIELPDP